MRKDDRGRILAVRGDRDCWKVPAIPTLDGGALQNGLMILDFSIADLCEAKTTAVLASQHGLKSFNWITHSRSALCENVERLNVLNVAIGLAVVLVR